MPFLAVLALLLGTLTVNCDSSSSDVAEQKEDYSDLIKDFESCDVKCSGKFCECCQKFREPSNVEVCGSSAVRIAEKSMDLTLKVEGDIKADTTVKLDHLLNFCIPVKTKGGKLGICIITSLADDKSNPAAIDICINVDVSVDGVNFIRASFNCAKFDGDVQIEGETNKDGLKTFGSVKVVNGKQLATFVHKLVFGK